MARNNNPNDLSINTKDIEQVNSPLLSSHGSPNANETSVMIQSSNVEPKDRGLFVYGVFILLGISILIPWNVFLTATDYFVNYKFDTNSSANATYRNDFTFIVGITSQTVTVLMNFFNTFVPLAGNPKNRIPYLTVLSAVVLVFHIAMAIVDSQSWPYLFFVLVVISVVVMNIATGLMQSCVYYLAGSFPMQYMNAIVLGNNLCGIYVSVMNVVSKISTPNLRLAGIYYFLSAFIVVMLSLIAYFAMHRSPFYHYWMEVDRANKQKKYEESNNTKMVVPYLKIIGKIWPLLFSIWLNFFSTLAIFPVFQLGIQRSDPDFIISDRWFVDFTVFLTFNISVTLGNLLPNIVKWPGPRFLPILVILRALIVFPFFIFCNFEPNLRNIPVLITNDYVYWFGAFLSPFMFGYFTSLLMMYTPKQVDQSYAGTAGMLSVLALVIGVFTGIQFSQALKYLVLL